ncbi:MAG: UDP-N-acetylmuramate dehydrogenase [Pseudomonadales bacterium]
MSVSLRSANTLAVSSEADTVHEVRSTQALLELLRGIDRTRVLILGGGSNVLLAPCIERPVLLIRSRGIRRRGVSGAVEVEAAAGESWHELVRWTLGQGLRGLENLALIPGSVGAAPVQNIGAYGVELSRVLTRLEAVDLSTGSAVTLGVAECEFGYRDSLFKHQPGRFLITSVTLRLVESLPASGHSTRHSDVQQQTPALETGYPDVQRELLAMGISRPDAVAVAEAVIRVRRRKLPDARSVPNAGSFFKNPIVSADSYRALRVDHPELLGNHTATGIKLAAAQLIDLCGFKMRSGGPVRVWHRQPLVLTNPGRADGTAVLAYARSIQQAVEERFGLRLEIEPDLIGFS